MKKKIFLFLLIPLGILLLLFFIFFNKKENPDKPQQEIIAEEKEIAGAEEPLQEYSSKNNDSFEKALKKAQKTVSFPIKYPQKIPEGYAFLKMDTWSGNTEGINIYYKSKENNNIFNISGTDYSPFYGTNLDGEIVSLPGGEIGYLFSYKNLDGANRNTLYFYQHRKDTQIIYYTLNYTFLEKEKINLIVSSLKTE